MSTRREPTMLQRLVAEGIGSVLLAATVIGSGIMAERLAGGNVAVALLANTAATVAVLATLIAMLGPVSGAHFNPAVSSIQVLRRELTVRDALAYISIQIVGCCAGALLAHMMFELPLIQASAHVRAGPAQWLSELVATAGLILVVISSTSTVVASWRVAAWIGAAYWFTASTSFANPAITLARTLNDTFAGIRPMDAPAFIITQLIGAYLGFVIGKLLFVDQTRLPKATAAHPALSTDRGYPESGETASERLRRQTRLLIRTRQIPGKKFLESIDQNRQRHVPGHLLTCRDSFGPPTDREHRGRSSAI